MSGSTSQVGRPRHRAAAGLCAESCAVNWVPTDAKLPMRPKAKRPTGCCSHLHNQVKQQDFLRMSFRETPGDLLELRDRELMLRQLEACAVRRCNPDCDPLLLLSRYRICCTAGRAASSAVRAPTRTAESVLLRVIEFFFNETY